MNAGADTTVEVETPLETAAPVAQPGRSWSAMITPVQIGLMVLAAIAFVYFARPVLLPVFLACVAGMALKPIIRWLSDWHIPPVFWGRRRAVFPRGRCGSGIFSTRPAGAPHSGAINTRGRG